MVNRMYGWARPGHPRPKGRGSPSYRISSAAGAKKPGCRDGRLPRLEGAERLATVSQEPPRAPPGAAPTAGAAERGQDRPEPKPGAAEARSLAPGEPRRQVRERPRHRDA